MSFRFINRSRLLAFICFICIITVLLLVFCTMNDNGARENMLLAEKNINRAAVQCYALEGFYPPDIDYLIEHYGVRVDETKYFVDYQYVAANLAPDITVLPLSD